MRLALVLVTLLCATLNSAAAEIRLSKEVFRKVPFSSQFSEDGALIRSVDFRSVNDLIPQLEKKFAKLLGGAKLSDRNEAHITVITPPEAKTGFFKNSIGIDQVYPTDEMIADHKTTLQDTSFKVLCVGKQQNKSGNVVFYLVVESDSIMQVRQDIEKRVKDRDGKQIPFKTAGSYYPHITIGYKGGDVHGVSKGKETCVADVELI